MTSDYFDTNGIRLYYEIYGDGEPIVMLPGGMMTIPELSGIIEPLSKTYKVIGVEPQGHGHTADTDRPLKQETMADDVAALLDHLGLESAHVFGYSLGAEIALRVAFQHPKKVRRLVVMSTGFARDGWYPEAQQGMASVNASLAPMMMNTPCGKLSQQWPEPQRFATFLDKIGAMLSLHHDWSAEVRKLKMPVLLIYGDHDSVSQQHIANFFALLGGGISEPGWQNTKFTNARLAIIPGYSHYNLGSAPELAPIIERFLKESMAGSTAGAAAASTAAAKR